LCISSGIGVITVAADFEIPNDLRHNELRDCTICAANRYQNEAGKDKCKSCPDKKVITDNAGSSLEHDDVTKCLDAPIQCKTTIEYAFNGECLTCPQGYYCDGTTKFVCNYGAYCPGDGTKSLCPAGTYGDSSGQVTLSNCKDCDIGTYNKIPGSTSCSNRCPPGTHNSEKEGSASPEEACIPCPIGSFCSFGARTFCPKGTYNDEMEISSSDGCTKCKENTYNDQENQTKAADCIPCGEDAITKKTLRTRKGAVDFAECELTPFKCPVGQRPILETDLDDCEDCPSGTYGGNGESCVLCPTGYFQAFSGETDCDKCKSCSNMPGATSNVDNLKTALLPKEFVFAQETLTIRENNETTGGVTAAVSIIKEDKKETDSFLSAKITYILYGVLTFIGVTVVLFHRSLPMGFKNFDLFFAGDHYIEDSVRIFYLFLFLAKILLDITYISFLFTI